MRHKKRQKSDDRAERFEPCDEVQKSLRKKQETLDSADQIEQPRLPGDVSAAKREIIQAIEENIEQLLGIIRSYVLRFGLASGNDVPSVALEVFQEVVVEALAHSENFAGPKKPVAWLLGIAINIIRRRKAADARRYSHEMHFEPSSLFSADGARENDLLQQWRVPLTDSPEHIVEDAEQVQALLSLVPEEDRKILSLAVLNGLRHDAIAKLLGITPDATRSRLHRALVRLRTAWHKQQEQNGQQLKEGGK